jgi:hypothetical protein
VRQIGTTHCTVTVEEQQNYTEKQNLLGVHNTLYIKSFGHGSKK